MRWLKNKLLKIAESREPDVVIGGHDNPYLKRWHVIPKNRFFNIYLHHFLRSDDDRALHDHPWCNASWLLEGCYNEHMPNGVCIQRQEGAWYARRASAAHRVELLKVYEYLTQPNFARGYSWIESEAPVWTLFITGPKIREWGFLCPKGWKHWKDFVSPTDKGSVGEGCGE